MPKFSRGDASLILATLTLVLSATFCGFASEAPPKRPVALALSRDGEWLYVAQRLGGGVSTFSTRTMKVASEVPVGRGLADLVILPDGRGMLAVDRLGDALVALSTAEGSVQVEARITVAPDPVSVLVDPSGKSCVVASTRSRRLTVVTITGPMRVERSVELPFAPRNLAWIEPGAKLVVADAFGGRMAVVDPVKGSVESSWILPAHNIRGLALSPDGKTLVLAHQTLHRLARSTFEDVHWGSLVSNHLRVIDVDVMLDPRSKSSREGRLLDLGEVGDAAGDPGPIAFAEGGKLAVTLGGVDQLAVDGLNVPTRVGVGRKPSGVVYDARNRRFFVLEELDDSIAVIDAASARRVGSMRLGPLPNLSAVDRGERLFSDARLSHDGWMSCQSCHTDGQTNGQLADTLSDGSFGAPKRVTTLLGAWSTAPWTWLGTETRLEDQVRKSVVTTMRGKVPTVEQVDDLSAYLRTLDPPPPTRSNRAEVATFRGWDLFRTRGCADCHAPPDYTMPGRYDVALPDELGNRRFNPPSLRDVGTRRPLLHDGRASDLSDVFLKHRHPRDAEWTSGEVADLVEFLNTL